MITSLAAARFNRSSEVSEINPLGALRAALEDDDVKEATHVIVVYGRLNEDGSCQNGWMQGGKLDAFAQVGLLSRVLGRFTQEA